jgi:hypothetical protein
MAHVNVALVQQVLDMAERQREPGIHDHREVDDREAHLELAKWGASFTRQR